MSKFTDSKNFKYGTVGEELVLDYFRKKCSNYNIYYPENNNKAHWVDFFIADKTMNKLFALEVKTKPSRIYYPDTGIEQKHFNEYQILTATYKIDVFIAFVDKDKKQIYGNYIRNLLKPVVSKGIDYPLYENRNKTGGKIIYFPLTNMIIISNIPNHYTPILESLSQRNTKYEQVNIEDLPLFNYKAS